MSKILINNLIEIKGDFEEISTNDYEIRSVVEAYEQVDSLMSLFPDRTKINISIDDQEYDLVKKMFSYSSSNTAEFFNVNIGLELANDDNTSKIDSSSIDAQLIAEQVRNRIRIDVLQKILTENELVSSESDFRFDENFTEEELREKWKQYSKEVLDAILGNEPE